jgi:hypothetical protein
MVMAGPGSPLTVERPGTVGALLLPESKLGSVTMLVLPPRTSTPGAAEIPVGAEPAPPRPGVGEMPVRTLLLGSEPREEPDFPAPVASVVGFPARPLPEPEPAPIPVPAPEPPRPGLSPPAGDRARDPLLPLPGTPGLEPGSPDKTTPELSVVPLAALGGARAEPMSPGAPRPKPFLPEPELTEVELGGGGIMLLARRPPLAEALELLVPVPEAEPGPTDGGGGTMLDEFRFDELARGKFLDDPFAPEVAFDPETDGGGGITLDDDVDLPEGEPPRFEVEFPTEGGGGMTLVARDVPEPPALREFPAALEEVTVGGGGTTSCVPKSLPMMLLTKDPLAA